jgi:hypothetical protein
MVVSYWKMGWLPSLVPGSPFDEPEESTMAAMTTLATATTPTPVQNHHVLYTGVDSLAGAGVAA